MSVKMFLNTKIKKEIKGIYLKCKLQKNNDLLLKTAMEKEKRSISNKPKNPPAETKIPVPNLKKFMKKQRKPINDKPEKSTCRSFDPRWNQSTPVPKVKNRKELLEAIIYKSKK